MVPSRAHASYLDVSERSRTVLSLLCMPIPDIQPYSREDLCPAETFGAPPGVVSNDLFLGGPAGA